MTHDKTNNRQTSRHIFTENNAQLHQHNGIDTITPAEEEKKQRNKHEKMKRKKKDREK